MFDFDLSKYIALPVNAAKDVVSAAKTAALTHEIHGELAAGKSMAEVLASRLPASENDETERAAELIERGVADFYESQETIDVGEMLNRGMTGLGKNQRIVYLRNLTALIPDENLTEEARAVIAKLDNGETLTEDETNHLISAAETVVDEYAGVLSTASVQAMTDDLEKLPPEYVARMANFSRDTARAQAAACYVLRACGENPWLNGEDVSALTPYDIGAAAAAGVETSRLVRLKLTGQIKAEALITAVKNIIRRAIAFVARNWLKAAAIAMKLAAGVWIAEHIVLPFFILFSVNPIISIVASAFLGTVIINHLVSVDAIVELLETLINDVRSAFEKFKAFVTRLFAHAEAGTAAEDADVSDEETAGETVEETAEETAGESSITVENNNADAFA